jgi:transcriptional regulator with XRE-family HTH domain
MGQINPESWPDRQVLITRRLRQRRAELGLTQKQVVTRLGRCGLHTTNRAVSSLEHGAGVDVAKLPELALALDCTITYLIGLTDDPHRWEPDQPAGPPHQRHPSSLLRPAPDPPAADRMPAPSWILGLEVPDRPGRLPAGSGT